MRKGLERKRIILTGSRKTEEMCTLVEKQGGIPIVRPAQGTVFLDEKEVEPEIERIVNEGVDWVVFTTGIGVETLFKIAENMGIHESFISTIHKAKVATRGYKTRSALKKWGIAPIAGDDDGTTQGLIRSLKEFEFNNQRLMVQLHGDSAPMLKRFLEGRGAVYSQILPYKHIAPDPQVLKSLCDEISTGKVDAVCFTTAMQVHFLFDYARENQFLSQLKSMFNNKVMAAAVGKITAEALEEEGVENVLQPEQQRMGAMIMKLSQYYSERKVNH
ncbi:uroporphyrinogen-III synthase [Fictibacillus phosphorivorans]|uniref:uroporphyrinogen-III synthase n=1 Tax=Fictibacillus phosphorivorans TaxID=1221500 RepID=UPI00203F2534|nr:uroporphyrinogen-III synthase [Fictibacillus phosphorivorans]MCM3718810.1 uroporphyrinogen-III synthase [Fictibacillus phosphorivorans]MCM3776433.1 uroporphyrinogen-III synthase [Fictibacillus phosphorivorans]